MAREIFKLHVFLLSSLLAIFVFANFSLAESGSASADQIPDSIQLSEELPAHSRFASAFADSSVKQVPYVQVSSSKESVSENAVSKAAASRTSGTQGWVSKKSETQGWVSKSSGTQGEVSQKSETQGWVSKSSGTQTSVSRVSQSQTWVSQASADVPSETSFRVSAASFSESQTVPAVRVSRFSQVSNGPAVSDTSIFASVPAPVSGDVTVGSSVSVLENGTAGAVGSAAPVSGNVAAGPAVTGPVQTSQGFYPPAVNGGVPVYSPDGSVPMAGPEVAVDEFEGMAAPAPGLFLADFCAPVCGPCGGGILGPGCLFVEGYVDQGFNVNSNSSSYGQPMAVNDKEGYQLNQLYFSFGRRIFKGNQWAVGGQIDVMYGTDYYYMSSVGLETSPTNQPHWNGMEEGKDEYRAGRKMYGMALPQAFAEVYAPILSGVSAKIGHFHSVMGFESNQANQNFFYSRSYTSVYGLPTSMTGVMTDWRLGDCFSIVAGAVNEWNSFDTPEDHFSFVIGATYENRCGTFALSALVMSGKQSAAGFQSNDYSNEGENTTVVDVFAKFKFTERLAYVVEFNYGTNDAEVYDLQANDVFKGRNWYGFSNYLFYYINPNLTVGARFEWFCDKENSLVSGGNQVTFANVGANYFSWTIGLNWDPCPWLTIRPEVRWDYCDLEMEVEGRKYYAFDRNSANYQFTLGCDAIVRF